MAKNTLASVLEHLRRIALTGDDARLLEQFANNRDEAAFGRLVVSHGPMVLGLCRRLLRHEQDAEDVFQATFLTLARKAGTISKKESLPSWLYKVAYRVACRVRRRELTNHMPLLARVSAKNAGDVAELRGVLDEEIAGLKETYRRPVLLCYLQGKTVEEAARLLGCPTGTVSSWLARAKEQLRQRLMRRGWAPAVVVGALSDKALTAALPAGLVRSTMAYVANSGDLSAKVFTLTEGVLRMLWLNRVKMVAGVVLGVVLAATSVGLVVRETWAEGEAGQPQQRQAAAEQKHLVQDSIGPKKAGPESVRALKKAEPTIYDLSRALGIYWWQFDLPKNIGAIEIGIKGMRDGQNRFTLIKRWEMREFMVPGPLKVAYQEEGHDEYKLVLITKGGSTQIPKNKKPSDVSWTVDQGHKSGEFFDLLYFANNEQALVIKME